MRIADFRHHLRLRVRWAEVDMQGVVFNAHYLTYCDVGITEYWRALGLAYPADFIAHGGDAYVRKASLDYLGPARYDDELVVCARVAAIGRSSLRFALALFRAHEAGVEPLVGAQIVYVYADLATHGAQPWPQPICERIRAFEVLAPLEGSAAHA